MFPWRQLPTYDGFSIARRIALACKRDMQHCSSRKERAFFKNLLSNITFSFADQAMKCLDLMLHCFCCRVEKVKSKKSLPVVLLAWVCVLVPFMTILDLNNRRQLVLFWSPLATQHFQVRDILSHLHVMILLSCLVNTIAVLGAGCCVAANATASHTLSKAALSLKSWCRPNPAVLWKSGMTGNVSCHDGCSLRWTRASNSWQLNLLLYQSFVVWSTAAYIPRSLSPVWIWQSASHCLLFIFWSVRCC